MDENAGAFALLIVIILVIVILTWTGGYILDTSGTYNP